MVARTNRATGKPEPQQGDVTALQLKRDEEAAAEAAAAKVVAEEAEAEAAAYEKKNVVVDYFEGADTPLPEVNEDEIWDDKPYRVATLKYSVENMSFGRKINRDAYTDDNGNHIPADLGGIRYLNFDEGRRYKLPKDVYDHLDERGFIYH